MKLTFAPAPGLTLTVIVAFQIVATKLTPTGAEEYLIENGYDVLYEHPATEYRLADVKEGDVLYDTVAGYGTCLCVLAADGRRFNVYVLESE